MALPDSLEMLDVHGRLVVMGGATPQMLDVRRLVESQAQVIGSVGNTDAADVHHIHKLLGEAVFLPVIDSIYPLSEAVPAYQRAESEEAFGAVVLVPDYLFRSREQVTEILEEE